jgi:hypothetical protein
MNNVIGLPLLSSLFLTNKAHAAVTRDYRLYFQGRFELGPEEVKEETLQLMPGLFARQNCDVDWKILREGSDFVEVRLIGISNQRILGWLNTLRTQTREAVREIREL